MKRLTLISLMGLGALLLSACGTPSATSWPGLAADAQNAYLANGQFVYAVRLTDGAKVWQYPDKAGTQNYFSNPVLTADGQLLVGSAGLISDTSDKETVAHTLSELISLDPGTGQPKWPAPFVASDHWVAPPLVVTDTVYAANNNGTLYALDLATGQKRWSLSLGTALWGAPVTNGKLIFVTSLNHYLYAVDPQAQKLAWKLDLGGSAPGSPSVSSDGSTLYAGSFARKVFSVDAAAGTVKWTAGLKDWAWASPVTDGNNIYAADVSGNLYSLAVADGQNTWPIVQPDGSITASPVPLGENIVFATESGNTYVYDRSGTKVWEAAVGGKIYTAPVIAGDRLLVAPYGTDFLLAALSQDGKLLWKFTGK